MVTVAMLGSIVSKPLLLTMTPETSAYDRAFLGPPFC
jgi:hypothetical protein